MRKQRKLFGILAVVAVAIVALTAGLSWSSRSSANAAGPFETLLATRMGISVESLHQLEAAAIAAATDRAVSEGEIQPAQAAAEKQINPSPYLEQAFSELATAVNTSSDDLFNQLLSQQTLAQVAAAHGVDRETLKGRLAQAITGYLDMAVTKGLLTSDQASQAKVTVDDRALDRLIDSTLPKDVH